MKLHIVRSNYVAYIFRHASELCMNLEPPSLHGWMGTAVQWTNKHFPTDIHSVLVTANERGEEEELISDNDIDEEDNLDIDFEDFR